MARKLFGIPLLLFILLGVGLDPALAKVEIRVDLDRQRLTVVKNHEPPITWKISSGRPGFETPTGTYIVQRMDADHLSDEYDQAPMPYAIFFSRGLAIHGTNQRGLGRPASHGCVRLSVEHARELYEWVEQYGASPIQISGEATNLASLGDDDAPPRRRHAKSESRWRDGDESRGRDGGDEFAPPRGRAKRESRRRDSDDDLPVVDHYYDFERIIRAR